VSDLFKGYTSTFSPSSFLLSSYHTSSPPPAQQSADSRDKARRWFQRQCEESTIVHTELVERLVAKLNCMINITQSLPQILMPAPSEILWRSTTMTIVALMSTLRLEAAPSTAPEILAAVYKILIHAPVQPLRILWYAPSTWIFSLIAVSTSSRRFSCGPHQQQNCRPPSLA